MQVLAIVAIAGAGLIASVPAFAQEASSPVAGSTLSEGQRVEGPITISGSFAIAYYYLAETTNGSFLIGEVENVGEVPAVPPTFQVQGLDEDGLPFGDQSYIFNEPVVVAPGERTVLNGSVGSGLTPESFGSMAFTPNERSDVFPSLPLEVEGIAARGKTKDAIGKKGLIRNTGDEVLDVRVLMAWYAPDGTAIGTCFGTTQGSIPPGKALPIQVTQSIGGCANTRYGAEALGVTDGDDTGYSIQFYSVPS